MLSEKEEALDFLILLTGAAFALVSFNLLYLSVSVLASYVYAYLRLRKEALTVLKLSAGLIVSFIASQSVFYWGFYAGQKVYVLFWIMRPGQNYLIDFLTQGKGIAITYQGFFWGLMSSAKLVTTLLLAYSFSKKFDPFSAIKLMKKFKLPEPFILGFLLTFRVLPVMNEMGRTIYAVGKVRSQGRSKKVLLPYLYLKSLIYNSVKRAYMITLAIETKGYPNPSVACKSKEAESAGFSVLFLALFIFLLAMSFLKP